MSALKRPTRVWLCYVLLGVITLLVWGRTIQFDFVWDDHDFVARNESVRSLKKIPSMFFTSAAQGHNAEGARIFRPLRTTQYAVLRAVGGQPTPQPWIFHLANILWHAVAAMLLFAVARLLLQRQSGGEESPSSLWLALLIAIGFAVHPVTTEVVSWVKAVDDIMAAVFVLAATRALLQWTPGQKMIAALVYFALAVYSKESAAPFALLAIFIFRGLHKLPWKSCFTLASGFLAIALVYILHRHLVMGQSFQSAPISGSYWQTLGDMFPVVTEYVRLLFGLPPFRIDYSFMGHNPFLSADVLVGLMILLALVAVGVWAWRGKVLWLAGFGLLWTGLFLLPVANVLPMMQYMAERFLYLPLIGWLLVIGALLLKMFHARVAFPIATLLVLAWTPLSLHRSTLWRDDVTLFTRSYEEGVKTPAVEDNAVFALLHQPRPKTMLPLDEESYQLTAPVPAEKVAAAVQALTEIRRTFPENENLLTMFGMVYLSNARAKEAIPFFEATTKKNPKRAQWWINLAMAYRVGEDPDKAQESFEKALVVDPNHRVALKLYSVLCLETKDYETALNHLQALEAIDPQDPDLANLISQAESGLQPADKKIFASKNRCLQILKDHPDDAEAHAELGHLLFLQGDKKQGTQREKQFSEASAHFRAAIKMKPDYGDALNDLAWILATEKSLLAPAEAVSVANKACASAQFRSPGFFDTLAVAYAANGQTDEAIETCQKALKLVSTDPALIKVLQDRIQTLSSPTKNAVLTALLPAKKPLVWDSLEKSIALRLGEENVEFTFWVTNTSRAEITITQLSASCNCTKPLRRVPWKIAPGKSESMKVTIDAKGKSGNVAMLIDVISSVGTETLTMKLEMPTSVAAANPLVWDTMEKNLVPSFGDTQVEFTFWVTNTSPSAEVIINRLVSSCDCTTTLTPVPWKLSPGASGPMKAVVDIKGGSGNLNRTMNVMSTAGNQTLSMDINIPKL